MATAATVAGGASGLRAWLAAKRFSWLSPFTLRRVTFALVVAVILVSATVSGTGP
jgi:hypothetical protein